jgi:hypothetical protein
MEQKGLISNKILLRNGAVLTRRKQIAQGVSPAGDGTKPVGRNGT